MLLQLFPFVKNGATLQKAELLVGGAHHCEGRQTHVRLWHSVDSHDALFASALASRKLQLPCDLVHF